MAEEFSAGFWLSPQQRLAYRIQAPDAACLLSLTGAVDADRVRKAVEQIASRHEILRTVFRRQTGMKLPFQVVLDRMDLTWREADLTTLDPVARDNAIESLWNEAIASPGTAEQQPGLHGIFIKVADNRCALILTASALCCDAKSLELLLHELALIYAGEVSSLAEPFRYAQFAQWQEDLFESADEDASKAKSFWSKQLESFSRLALPNENAADKTRPFAPAVVRVPVADPQAVAVLEEKPAVWLLSAWACLLHRLSGQSALALGYLVDNREYEELEHAFGCFARTVPLTLKIESHFGFSDVTKQSASAVSDAIAWQEYFSPETIGVDGDLVAFAYQELVPAQKATNVEFSLARVRAVSERYKLRLVVLRRGNELALEFQYDPACFSRTAVERIAGYYQNLLAAALAHPETPVSRLPLLSEAERRQLLVDWNRTAAEYPRTACLQELFEQQAARTPERMAVRSGDQAYSYRELNERANQLAHYLRAQGVGPDRPVGLCLERSADTMVAVLAILKAGGAYVPLNPDNPPARLKQQLAGAAAIVTTSKMTGAMPTFAGPIVLLDDDRRNLAKQPKTNPTVNTTPENLVYIIYTSGSTGVPKGVCVRHRNLVNYAHFITRRLELEKYPDGLQFATVSTLGADLGNSCIYPALISGGTLHIIAYEMATDPQRFASYISKHPLDVLKIVPSHLSALLQSEQAEKLLPRKYLIFGGETLTPKLLEKVAALKSSCAILNHYGPTETTVGSLTLKLDEYDWKKAQLASIPLGKPIANTQVYILDPNLEPVPLGVTGELYIAGDGVTAGYLEQPEKTAERFLKNPFASDPNAKMYRTGDLARYGEDGNIEFLGRGDDQVKVRGFRIELGEIESALGRHAAVKQALVLARENENGDKRLLGYVVLAPPSSTSNGSGQPSGEDLRNYLKQQLPDYMVPQAVMALPKLPLTPNGKIDRQALPEPTQGQGYKTYVAPRNATEEKITQIWAEVLRRPAHSISVDDNFFDLGGHSLMAIRLVNEIGKVTGVEIPLTTLFQGATVEHMANIILGKETITRTVIQQIQAGGSRAPFFAAVLAGVNSLGYVPLAKRLGSEQPFYTLQTPGPGPRAQRRPYTQKEYEQVAADYIKAMRSIQPNGPYHIGGICEGARIAFEMARILEGEGQEVALLAIIDTWVLENTQNRRLWKIYYYSVRLRQIASKSVKEIGPWLLRALRNQFTRAFGSKSAPPRSEWLDVYWPGQDFVAPRIRTKITLFKVPKQPYYYNRDPLMGWASRSTAGVDVHIIPNGRHRFLLREPYVRELAATLSRALDQLQPPQVDHEQLANKAEVVGAS